MSEISDFGIMTEYPKKGEPIYDIPSLVKYCKEKKIEITDGVPKEILEMFYVKNRE